VLRFIAEGFSSKEIGERLGISVRTVENHRASITRRTGLRSIAQLTLHAVRLGLVEVPAVHSNDPVPK
jgi:DNA-binding CsgD family transcriptional regulator